LPYTVTCGGSEQEGSVERTYTHAVKLGVFCEAEYTYIDYFLDCGAGNEFTLEDGIAECSAIVEYVLDPAEFNLAIPAATVFSQRLAPECYTFDSASNDTTSTPSTFGPTEESVTTRKPTETAVPSPIQAAEDPQGDTNVDKSQSRYFFLATGLFATATLMVLL